MRASDDRDFLRADGEGVDARALEKDLDPDEPEEVLRLGGKRAEAILQLLLERGNFVFAAGPGETAVERKPLMGVGNVIFGKERRERRLDLRLSPGVFRRQGLALDLADRVFEKLR